MSDATDPPIDADEKAAQVRAAKAEAAFSPEQQLAAVTSELTALTSSIEGCELFLQAFTEMELRQGFISELVKRSVSKLSPLSRQLLEHEGVFSPPSSKRRLFMVIVSAFAVVVVISAIALAWSAIQLVPEGYTATNAGPILLTLFTTAVGFLSGCGLFAPQSDKAPPRPIQRDRKKRRGTTNQK